VDTHVLLHQHAGKEAMLRFLDARHNTSVLEAVMQAVVDLKVQHLFVLDGATSKGKLAEKEKRKLVFSKALADLRAAVDAAREEVVITSQCALGHFTGRDIGLLSAALDRWETTGSALPRKDDGTLERNVIAQHLALLEALPNALKAKVYILCCCCFTEK